MDADYIMSVEFAMRLQQQAHVDGDLLVWTICTGTTDYPGKFTARPHSSRQNHPLRVVLLADTLQAAQEALPPGLFRINRSAEDDPVVLESWV